MTCPSCGRSNGPGARFCGGCGASLAPKCRACGTLASPGARFCEGCGAPLASEPAEKAIARKIVTVVFADLIGSVSLHERQDAESARRVIDRYHRAMRAAVEIHGGRVVQLLGDGVLAAFGVPTVAEDDALRAARAAFGMHRAFRELGRELGDPMAGIGLRVALNTGEVVVSDDETAVIGDATNVAARLQSEARDGEVIVGEATQRLIGELVTLAPLGSFALKGRKETVGAYRLVSLERPPRALAAFVGRDDELRRLLSVYDEARHTPAARLAVLLGSPGLGKSRLLAELVQRVGERATVLGARCDEARGATFAPLAEALRGLLGVDAAAGGGGVRAAIDALVEGSDEERARIGAGIAALVAGAPAPPEETFFVVRRFLAALAAVRPVVLAIDDLHWAEPLLLDLVEHLVQWTADAPLLIVAAARPELREARSSLATPGPLVADVLTLGGLDAGAATRLAAAVIGASELPAALAGRVLAASEGNPLFVSELVRMLVHDGTLRREAERWVTTVALAELDMPPTIGVLLAARIERLRPEERAVLERAAVVGRHFSREAVAHLLGRDAGSLDARLEALRRSELIEPDTGWFLGDPGLRFHHALIRDAAYRRVLRETRAELHERFADWVAARAGDSVEHDETIGWHLEQALDNRRELGPLDARAIALGERAAQHLGVAGQRALARDDLALAAGLLGRALACLPAEHDSRAQLALDWCEALLSAGEVAPAQAAVEELGRLAAGSERLLAWHTCFRGQLAALTDPQSLRATAREVAAAAETLVRLDDSAGQAKAHFVHASALARLGEIGAGESALDRALAAARRAQDRRRANAVLTGVPQAALWGPSPVTRASGRCLDVVRVLRITQGAPAVEAVALRCQAVLEALRGRTDAARRMVASSRAMVEELGLAPQLFEADVFAGHIELLEGEAPAAERCLRSAYEGLREHGLGIDAARAAALLGRALLAQGRGPEAEVLSHESESLAGDDLKAAMGWRGVRAGALARRAEHAAALELAREAVEIASRTDNLLDHADARIALAATLRAAGRRAESDTEERRALELWERKGATLLVERARVVQPTAEAKGRGDDAPTASRAGRRLRPNAATRYLERMNEACAAHDEEAVLALNPPDLEVVDHQATRNYGREGMIASLRPVLRAENASAGHIAIATLGDRLALFRLLVSMGGLRARHFDVGAYERPDLSLVDVDDDERATHIEMFAADRLGEALARMYERYAELSPPGPERERAHGTARTVASLPLSRDPDVDQLALSFSEDIEFVDERPAGPGTLRGSEAVLRSVRAIVELSEGFTARTEEVLAASPDALLVRNVTSGIVRASGGAFERPVLTLVSFDSAGLLGRWEQLDVDREAAALVRFDAIASQSRADSRRSVRPNLATAWTDRCCAAVAARDLGAIEALHSPELEDVQHTTGVTLGFHEWMANWRGLHEAQAAFALAFEPIATLGDRLGLFVQTWAGAGLADRHLDAGPYRHDAYVVFEVDAQGRLIHSDEYRPDSLADAVARLYSRHAELVDASNGAARATALVEWLAKGLGPMRLDAVVAGVSADVVMRDLRTAGIGEVRGAAAFREALATLFEMADGLSNRLDAVLAVRGDALLARIANVGRERASGGEFERPFLMLAVGGADGRVARLEQFDVGHEAEALARFDALARAPEQALSLENAATRALARFEEAWHARNWPAVVAGYAPGHRMDDRRKLVRLEVGGASFLSNERMLFDLPQSRWRSRALSVFGERVALFHVEFTGGADDTGPMTVEVLDLVEVDSDGRRSALAVFDVGDERAALEEGIARGRALEPALEPALAVTLEYIAAFNAHDRERLRATLAPELVVDDHRLVGPGRIVGADAYLEGVTPFWTSSPDQKVELVSVLGCAAHGSIAEVRTFGSGFWSDGGEFEVRFVSFMIAERGRITRQEVFELTDAAAALARFAELRPDPLSIPPNAATRASDRRREANEARDFEAYRALLSPDLVYDDRRRAAQVRGGREMLVESNRLVADAIGMVRRTVLATAGDRILLERCVFARGGSAEFEVEVLRVSEVDAEGRMTAMVYFDPDDRRGASRELLDRWERSVPEPARSESVVRRAVLDRDASLVCALPPDFVFVDHRLGGPDRIEGAEAYERWIATLLESSPDAIIEPLYFLEADERGMLCVGHTFGTSADGGSFENVWVLLAAPGRTELFHVHDLDRARARFAELRPDPLRIPPSTATRASDRHAAAVESRDWDACRELYSPELVFEDRRRDAQTRGGREMLIESNRVVVERGVKAERTLLATAGDRIALERCVFARRGRAELEVEVLRVYEVDAEGQMSAEIYFDPDDRRGASRELLDRWERSVPEQAQSSSLVRRAVLDRDASRLHELLPPDFVYIDHRLGRAKRIEGAHEYQRWIASLLEVSPDAIMEPLYILEADERGTLSVSHAFCTSNDGGTFENVSALLSTPGSTELFDLHDLDRARARFAELRADPLRIPPNAAFRLFLALRTIVPARDWAALRALAAPDFAFDDRQRRSQVRGDIETFVRNLEFVASWPKRTPHVELLATAGERLALDRLRYSGEAGDSAFEGEFLRVVELDAAGKLRAVVYFDADDRRGASLELLDRWVRGAPEIARRTSEVRRAVLERDPSRVSEVVPADFVYIDHRLGRPGRIEGVEAFGRWMATLLQGSPDAIIEPLYFLEVDERGTMQVGHTFGTSADGGAFENTWIGISTPGNMELFEIDDLERARARFAELRADPLYIPPNAAWRAWGRIGPLMVASDWDALRALAAPDFRFEDRQRHTLVSGDIETYVRQLQFVTSWPDARAQRDLVATAWERLALDRLRYSGKLAEGGPYGGEFLRVIEIDEQGRLRAVLYFDADDRAAAFAELAARSQAAERSGPGQAPIFAFMRALRAHDPDAVARVLDPDFVFQDHKALGFGTIARDEFLLSLRAEIELAPGATRETLRVIALASHGALALGRRIGTLRDGGAFEVPSLTLSVTDGREHMTRFEVFEPSDGARARARFRELCPDAVFAPD